VVARVTRAGSVWAATCGAPVQRMHTAACRPQPPLHAHRPAHRLALAAAAPLSWPPWSRHAACSAARAEGGCSTCSAQRQRNRASTSSMAHMALLRCAPAHTQPTNNKRTLSSMGDRLLRCCCRMACRRALPSSRSACARCVWCVRAR
jgi:hypothetical protein